MTRVTSHRSVTPDHITGHRNERARTVRERARTVRDRSRPVDFVVWTLDRALAPIIVQSEEGVSVHPPEINF